jgi:3-hydroxyacyl-[acyl-carrier-protein] dehydratase
MCESIAQLGAYALLSRPDLAGRLALFGGLDGVRFRRQVLPGERLDLEVDLGRVSARAGRGTGRALVDGEEACRCDLLFVFVKDDPS